MWVKVDFDIVIMCLKQYVSYFAQIAILAIEITLSFQEELCFLETCGLAETIFYCKNTKHDNSGYSLIPKSPQNCSIVLDINIFLNYDTKMRPYDRCYQLSKLTSVKDKADKKKGNKNWSKSFHRNKRNSSLNYCHDQGQTCSQGVQCTPQICQKVDF